MYDEDLKMWNSAETPEIGEWEGIGKNISKERKGYGKALRLEREWSFWETDRNVTGAQRKRDMGDEAGEGRGQTGKIF